MEIYCIRFHPLLRASKNVYTFSRHWKNLIFSHPHFQHVIVAHNFWHALLSYDDKCVRFSTDENVLCAYCVFPPKAAKLRKWNLQKKIFKKNRWSWAVLIFVFSRFSFETSKRANSHLQSEIKVLEFLLVNRSLSLPNNMLHFWERNECLGNYKLDL